MYEKMTPEEKEALKLRNDEIDQIEPFPPEKDEDDFRDWDIRQLPEKVSQEEFLLRHNLNLAKVFLGKDGGYSIRKYKKILFNELKF